MSNKVSSVPFVVEKGNDTERTYDIYSRLLEDRIVFIGTEITNSVANSIIAQLLLLDQRDDSRDIKLYINSGGGSVTAGMAIYDTINYIRSDVMTVCVGLAASMGALLLAAGTKGKRISLPNSRIMIHEPLQTSGGQSITTTDQKIDTDLLIDMRRQLAEILIDKTGQNRNKILKDIQRDYWMNPPEALKYGLIDRIIDKKPE